MQIRKTIDVPATTREVVEFTVCDLCGRKEPGDGWSKCYDVEDVEVSYESGSRYPDGNFTETISYDICPDCFKNKLMPWLESQGAKHRKKDNIW